MGLRMQDQVRNTNHGFEIVMEEGSNGALATWLSIGFVNNYKIYLTLGVPHTEEETVTTWLGVYDIEMLIQQLERVKGALHP